MRCQTLEAVIIVKNREKTIERCLESIKDIDIITICDTGSSDNTIEICKKYTDKVYTDYKWNDDFAEARNHAASYATGDWIFVIDSDEWLEGSIKDIKDYLENLPEELKTAQLLASNGIIEYLTPRFYRRNSGIEYAKEFPVHEMFTHVDGNSMSVARIMSEQKKINDKNDPDPDRNLRILKKAVEKFPEQPRLLYYLGKEYAKPYRKMYKEAIEVLSKYAVVSKFKAELEDSYLVMSYCYDQLGKDNEARIFAGLTIISNPNSRQAILFMIDLADEEHKNRWRQFLEGATDEGSLIRVIK